MEARALIVVIWLACLATLLVASINQGINFSTDDAMRLVEVRDLLNGQGWFDLTQHRLNPPDGVVMHWSRLIDLPLALLIRAGETVLSAPLAERVAAVVWRCCSSFWPASRASRASWPATPRRGWP